MAALDLSSLTTKEAPDYTSRVDVPRGPSAIIQPLQIAQPNASGVAEAAGAFGAGVMHFAEKLADSQDETRAAQARTNYITKLADLRTKYENDQDFQNAGKNFATERASAEKEYLGSIQNPQRRASVQLHMRTEGLSAQRAVETQALAREQNVNVASLNSSEAAELQTAANAASPLERDGANARYADAVDGAVKAGWIDPTNAVTRKKRFATALDLTDLQRDIRRDPEKAALLLDDAKNYPTLDPVTREQWKNTAKNAADTRGQLDLVNSLNPVGALATAGRITDIRHAKDLFDKGIVPAEGGEKDGVALVSPKGAIGVSQIMPGTARDMATSLGLTDVAALSDAELTTRLKDDKALNYRLGLAYWNDLARRYGGNVPVMAAAYNGGPGRADKWLAEATAKFGPGFSAEQLASVVDIKETRDYISKVYANVGGEPSGGALSPEGRFHVAQKIAARLNAEENERRQVAISAANVDALASDPLGIKQAGYNPDPVAEARFVSLNLTASQAGDTGATKRLMAYAEAKRLEPMVRQAYATAPAQLDQIIAGEENRLNASPNVSLAEKNNLDALKTVRDEVARRKASDPVTLGAAAGLWQPVALDPKGDPNDPAWRAALQTRGGQALQAQKIYQGSAAPLMPQEAAALKARWTDAGETERFDLLKAFATMPAAARDGALDQVGADSIAKTAGAFMDRPELAREILHGGALLGTSGLDKKASAVREAARGKLGGEVWPSADMQDRVLDAAIAVYTARRGTSNALYDPADEGGIEKAIEAVGGPFVKRNGRKVPVPPGVTPATFDYALDNLSDGDVKEAGGAYGRGGKALDAREVGQRAQLVPLEVGSPLYAVLMPTPDGKGAPVMTLDAGPMVLDISRVARRYSQGITATNIEMMRAVREQQQLGATLP